MENNIYFDTNVFIDLLDSTRPFARKSIKLFKDFLSNGKTIYINSDTVTTAFYILSKQKKYTDEKLLDIFKKLISLFVIVPIENKESIQALSLCQSKNNSCKDYEDTLQYVCAKKINATLIVTNDKNFISLDIECKGGS